MPLARYELQSEYCFANPELYKAVPKNDAEALFESITMAALAGIVRQLGEVAELAAEIFNDLHQEVVALSSRGKQIARRVGRLEAELTTLEETVYCESDQLSYAFTEGFQWHPTIFVKQNHFSQPELPRFLQQSYDDCREPPRFFLLDNFDVAGAGATLRRYTDPSFFRIKWANSELLKAERLQTGRRVRERGKKRETSGVHDTRQSITPEAKLSFIEASKFIHSVDAFSDPYLEADDTDTELRALKVETLRISAKEIEENSLLQKRTRHTTSATDSDFVDGAEHFVDALTSIEPDAEIENEKARCSTSSRTSSGSNQEAAFSVKQEARATPPKDFIQEDLPQRSPFNVQGATELSFYSSTSPSEISSPSASPSLSDLSEESYSSQQIFSVLDSPVVGIGRNATKEREVWTMPFRPSSPSEAASFPDEAPPPPPLPPSKWRVAKTLVPGDVSSSPAPEDLQGQGAPVGHQHHDILMDSIVSHDKDTLRKVTSDPRAKSFGSREVLLEQIRSRSFNLKHAAQQEKEKTETPCPATSSVNVATILEKASAIRQTCGFAVAQGVACTKGVFRWDLSRLPDVRQLRSVPELLHSDCSLHYRNGSVACKGRGSRCPLFCVTDTLVKCGGAVIVDRCDNCCTIKYTNCALLNKNNGTIVCKGIGFEST
ncbi:hypothetical protein SELMODRAFT_416077 [Selaginella moellendorffii]|uniref:Protein SCAR n=1 Tax=Selaginella moellendorffii TaxID=88036 RepID=D8RY05_SELML|nr:hypothetical protein SELMODRAFT_416077 [Selaginella moellendorffii]